MSSDTTRMVVAVFKEFSNPTLLKEIEAKVPQIVVRQAEVPCAVAKDPADIEIVKRNAKLFFPPSTPDAAISAVLKKLDELGLEILIRNPKTSTNFAMKDRVILQLKNAHPPSSSTAAPS